VSDITADLGGKARLNTMQRRLIDGFAGASIALDKLHVQMLLGEDVDPLDYAAVASTMMHLFQRISGIESKP
jgi:hypothetical protein